LFIYCKYSFFNFFLKLSFIGVNIPDEAKFFKADGKLLIASPDGNSVTVQALTLDEDGFKLTNSKTIELQLEQILKMIIFGQIILLQ
jgi:hypothetical protein